MLYYPNPYLQRPVVHAQQEVIWPNLGQSGLGRMLRFILAWALLFVIASFYLIPISGIQAIIEVQKLQKYPVFSTITKVRSAHAVVK